MKYIKESWLRLLLNSHPFVAHGKMKQQKEKSLKEYIDRIINPIFEKTLQEKVSNTMTTPRIFFRPNNYRKQIRVKEKNSKIINSIISHLKETNSAINFNQHTKLLSIKKYKENITLQYGKNTLTVIYSCPVIYGNKQGYEIERDTIPLIQRRINEIKQTIEKTLDTTLKEFSRKFNLSIPFTKPIWSRHEDFIKGEEFIDKLPRECIIHDTVFKKVYGKGIEFIGGKEKEPIVHLKNYIKNRAIEDIAPEIADSINKFGAMLTGNINLVSQIANINLEVTKLRRDVTKIQRKKKPINNKDLRKWL